MTNPIRVGLLIVLASLAFSTSAFAQMIVQIEANGEIITTDEGGVPVGGVDTQDYAFALNYGWGGETERDSGSGLPTGKRRHKPFEIIKPLARSSVLLRKAWEENQDIELQLRLFASDASGADIEVYRIVLTNGTVVGIRPFTDAATGQYLEQIQFAYTSLEFTDVLTGTSHTIQVSPTR